jgi:hypothetical protein
MPLSTSFLPSREALVPEWELGLRRLTILSTTSACNRHWSSIYSSPRVAFMMVQPVIMLMPCPHRISVGTPCPGCMYPDTDEYRIHLRFFLLMVHLRESVLCTQHIRVCVDVYIWILAFS